MRRKLTSSAPWGPMRSLLDGPEGSQEDPLEIEDHGEYAQGGGVEVEFGEQEGAADNEERQ